MIGKLPHNWAIAKIKELCDVLKDKGCEGVIPYLEIGDVNIRDKTYQITTKPSVKGCRIARENDVLVSRVRPDRGAITVIREKELQVSSAFTILRNRGFLFDKYLWCYLAWNKDYFNYLGENCTGTMYPTTSDEIISQFNVPVAPLNEQQRIVAKLEKILSKISLSQKRLLKIPILLKRFRQSILADACSGHLTADWRDNEGIGLAEWSTVVLNEVADMRLGKMLDKAKNVGQPTCYLRNINVRWFSFALSKLEKMRATSNDIKEFKIKNDDLLICEGGEPGRCAVWGLGETDLIFQKALHRVRLNDSVSPFWLALNIRNDANSGRLADFFTGTTIKHLTGQSLAKYDFPLPLIAEQQEIVKRVDSLFALTDKIETQCQNVQVQVNKLTQSVLAKAFCGELVPQGPNDEPAEVLLKRIKK